MLIESPIPDAVAASERTRVAMLTLRLRALRDELAAVTSAAAEWDHEAARAQLKARLDALLAERRRIIDESIEQARTEAAAAIAAAHVEAARLVAGVALEQRRTVQETPPASSAAAPDVSGVPAGTIRVNFDTEALAAAIAAVLDARPHLGAQQQPLAAPASKPVAKKSVAGSMMQPDVVLATISLLIVLAILFAWAS